MTRIVGQEQIAAVFGVAPKTIVEWQEQGFPVAQRGGPGVPSEYESADCIRWMVDRELKKLQAETPSDRLSRVKADAVEMDNAERRGLLVRADQIEPKLKAAFLAAREKWLDAVQRLSRELPSDLAGREAMLQAEFEAFLLRLASWSNAAEVEDDE